jgi:hypothetical protein
MNTFERETKAYQGDYKAENSWHGNLRCSPWHRFLVIANIILSAALGTKVQHGRHSAQSADSD